MSFGNVFHLSRKTFNCKVSGHLQCFTNPDRYDVLKHLLQDCKDQWDNNESSRLSCLRMKLTSFTCKKINKRYDQLSHELAERLLHGIISYMNQVGCLGLWKGGNSAIALIYHPVSGVIVVGYKDVRAAMFHSLGLSHTEIDAYNFHTERHYIIVAFHKTGNDEGGMGGVCAEITDVHLTGQQTFERWACAHDTTWRDGVPRMFAAESELDRHYYDRIFPEVIMKYQRFGPVIQTSRVSERLDVLAECLADAALRTERDNCRTLNLRLLQDLQEMQHKMKAENEALAKKNVELANELVQMKNDHGTCVEWLLKHNIFEAYTESSAPDHKYQQELVNCKKQLALQKRKNEQLTAERFKINQQLSRMREANELQEKESLKSKKVYDAHIRELQSTQTNLRHELNQSEHRVEMINMRVNTLQLELKQSIETASALRLDLRRANDEAGALRTDLAKVQSECRASPNQVKSPPEMDEMLYATLANMYSESFAQEVQTSVHGRYVHAKFTSDKENLAKEAAREFAYLNYVHDPNTRKNNLTWREHKNKISATTTAHECDALLREMFPIRLDELMMFIKSKFCDHNTSLS